MIEQRRRNRDQILTDLADHVAELVDPITHKEPHTVRIRTYYKPVTHSSHHDSLLAQLRACISDRPHEDIGTSHNTPSFNADALNRSESINGGVAEWLKRLDLKPRSVETGRELLWHIQQITRLFRNPIPAPIAKLRAIGAGYAVLIAGQVEPDLKAFVGVAPGLTTPNLHELDRDVARWRTWCRIVAGWERPAWQPQAPCPHCGDRPDFNAGLRVRAEIRAAVCLSCDATWSPEGVPIEILGEHIRTVREAVDEARTAALADQGPYSETQNRGGRS